MSELNQISFTDDFSTNNLETTEVIFLQELQNPQKYEELIIKASKLLGSKIQLIGALEKTNKGLEANISLKNKEILELKCSLIDKNKENHIKDQNYSKCSIENSEKTAEFMKMRRKYKKMKLKLVNLIEKNKSLEFQLNEKIIQLKEVERLNIELKKDLREIMRETIEKKSRNEEKILKKPEKEDINKENQLLSVKDKEIADKTLVIAQKNEEIRVFKRKDQGIDYLKGVISKINTNRVEIEDYPRVYYKIFDYFNRCVDFDKIYQIIEKSYVFFGNLIRNSSLDENYLNFLSKATKNNIFEELLTENEENKRIICFYKDNLQSIVFNFKAKNKENNEKIKILNLIINKQETLLNVLVTKNQDLMNQNAKTSINTNKITNYEKKIANYKEKITIKCKENDEIEEKYRILKVQTHEFEMLYNGLKLEYDQYRENIRKNFDILKKSTKNKCLDLPLMPSQPKLMKNKEKQEFKVIFQYFNSKIKGYNFKNNRFLSIVPKQLENDENMLIFEEFSNFISVLAQKSDWFYDIVNQMENNIDSLYLENYNLKILLLHCYKKILQSFDKKLICNELLEFLEEILKIKSGFVDSFDKIPTQEGSNTNNIRDSLDFERFQSLEMRFQSICNLIAKNIDEIQRNTKIFNVL